MLRLSIPVLLIVILTSCVSKVPDEPQYIFDMYGPDAKKPGTFAANALLARRLIEKGVRTVQFCHQGWDQDDNLPTAIRTQCKETDQPTTVLIKDLKQRGLLDETLVLWGREFGTISNSRRQLTANNYGRDHHPKCFTIFMAGAGIKAGTVFGTTDEFGYNVVENSVHTHDLQATILHLMRFDHKKLTFKHLGRRFLLTDEFGSVVNKILA